MINELVVAAGLGSWGYTVLYLAGCDEWRLRTSMMLSLPVGAATSILASALTISMGIGFSLRSLVAIGIFGMAATAIRSWHSGCLNNYCYGAALSVLVSAGTTAVLATTFRPILTYDSFKSVYLGRFLQDNELVLNNPAFSDYPLTILHFQALGRSLGAEFLVFVITGSAVLGILGAFDLLLNVSKDSTIGAVWIKGSTVAAFGILMMTSYMLRMQLSYLHVHLIFSAFFLLSVALFATSGEFAHSRPSFVIGSLLLATLSMTRVEGPVVVGLVLVAVVAFGALTDRRDLLLVGVITLSPMALWYGRLALAGGSGDILSPGRTVAIVLLSALPLLIAAVPFLSWVRNRIAELGLAMLVLTILSLSIALPEELAISIAALASNMAVTGVWGVVWWLILPMAIALAVFGPRIRFESAWLLLLFGFVLFVVALGALRATSYRPYRLGFGDSGNRIMVHVVPLFFSYIALKISACRMRVVPGKMTLDSSDQ